MRLSLSALYLALARAPAMMSVSADKIIYNKDLHAIFDTEWERGLRENPIGATYIGDHRYDDRWQDLSPAAAT